MTDTIDDDESDSGGAIISADARRAIMRKVRGQYFRTGRDDRLTAGIEFLLDLSTTEGAEGRALVVIGESGVGKTRTITHTLKRHPQLCGVGASGSSSPLVTVRAPAPCTLLQLGRTLLHDLGYPLQSDRKEHIVWEKAREHLELAGVRFLHIDEIQNVSRTANVLEAHKIRDTLKSLLNSPTWPVSLILSGLPEFAKFIQADAQIRRRSRFITFGPLTAGDIKSVFGMVKKLATIANLAVEAGAENTTIPRLLHAANYQMGIAIELTHEAIEAALLRGAATIQSSDFADAYAMRTGNGAAANPFLAPNWASINASDVLKNAPSAQDGELDPEEDGGPDKHPPRGGPSGKGRR